jgi:succinyl-CoA synthetase beta subunit
MKLHEFQSKEILSEYGIPVPRGKVARTPSQAATAAFDLGGTIVVKAQVHAGGRGNAGGIKVVNTPGAAEEAAASMLGTNLITHQTGPEGVPVQNVLIEEGLEVAEELYLGLVIDGSTKGVVVIASKSGGVNIEEVAENDPEKIIQIPIDPVLGLQGFQGRQIAYALGLSQKQVRIASSILESLYRVFIDVDASLLEINPLVITTDGELVAADAKINIDPSQEDPLEVQARESDINYVKLDGNIGCIVNGAGLAMATMDVSSAAKAAPANFLDIGGGADEEKVAKALTLVLSDPNVKAVLVNLFGGILRCDIAARGFVMAIERNPELERPMVIRMLGTNSEEGREILASSSLKVTIVETLDEAAEAISKLS